MFFSFLAREKYSTMWILYFELFSMSVFFFPALSENFNTWWFCVAKPRGETCLDNVLRDILFVWLLGHDLWFTSTGFDVVEKWGNDRR